VKRTHRLRWQAAAVMTVAAFTVAACSSGSGSSSSPGAGSSSNSSAALTASAPGITATQITIGSHQPLTGPAAPGYSEIAPASAAYFAYVNAHGGVYGRKIVYKYLNDAYNATTTASVVRQLVLQDNVYAAFNGLGTPTHLAAISFLNAQKVPDVFVASGCTCWNDPTKYPQTFGYNLDYVREGKILGQYVKQHFAGKKVGFFYQNDEFGMDGVKGLLDEIPASMVVSNVGSDPITLSGLLEAYAKQGGAKVKGNQLINGIISDGYLPTLGAPGNSWIALFKKVHDQYDPKAPLDGNVLYGMAVGYTFVQAMFKAGRNPTRADLVSAIQQGLPQGPSVAPYAYSSSDHSGSTGAFMAVIQNGQLVQQGSVLTTDDSASGAISTYSGSEQQAPASGIPSP